MAIYGYCCTYDDEAGYVYFIRDGLGHIKIGMSNDVQSRLAELQTANPMDLEYYRGLKFKNISDARKAEKELHKMFRDVRLRGEWFLEKPVMDFVDQERFEIAGYLFA